MMWFQRRVLNSRSNLVNALKSLNNNEITHYEMVNLFNTAEELNVFSFYQSATLQPNCKNIPRRPFLFFKGITVPRTFDLSEQMAHDIETFMKGQNSEYYSDLRFMI